AAEQALEAAHFDIVLLDLVLPDCAGEDTLNRFLSRPTDTTIVVLTGLDSEDMGERAVALGAQDFVVKGNHDHHAFLRIIRYARERAQAADTLVRAQRVDTVAQMAGSIAHDFNNMLQVILGHTEILREGVSRQANLTQSVEVVSEAAERAMRFTRQLLSFRTQRSSGMSVIDVDACLHALQPLLERILGEHITLVIDTRSEGSSIRAEAQIVEQMVVNLALNARAAMRNGGRLIVRSCRRPDPRRGEEAICIEVTDTGCGMPTAVQARAFEPFYTTRATGEGSGLGLSSTLSLARQFGGDVSLTSEEHRGTTVQIFLPEFVAHDSAPAEVPAARAASPCAQQTILYVDDEPMVVGIVRTMLTRAGFRCLAAEGPDSARALFAAHADEIDLIISDVIMPGTNGPTLCAELLARRPDLPVIYVSGFVDDPVLADSLNDSDRQRLVEKPFTPAKLLQTVSAMLPLREGVPASQSGA
ncbi:MAG: response regulator, partial [Pseudomonadales bacterium]|nr:response regulator [Pseudomonadales bacterium]